MISYKCLYFIPHFEKEYSSKKEFHTFHIVPKEALEGIRFSNKETQHHTTVTYKETAIDKKIDKASSLNGKLKKNQFNILTLMSSR